MSTPYDFAVIGAGIAGLSIAELLQRSGASVVLLEKESRLCSGASAEQQGWFHTGALYAALPDNFFCRTLVGNLDDLSDYYGGFPNMNLRVEKHVSAKSRDGWFGNRTNFYVYESCRTVGWKWKLPWVVALSRAKRRMSWFENLDMSRSLSRQVEAVTKPTRFVVHTARLGMDLGSPAFILKSRDRVMDSRLIAQDLSRSFLASGGRLLTQVDVTGIERGSVQGTSSGHPMEVRARHIIVTTGKATSRFDPAIRVFLSPLLVVVPAITDISFVRMSPHMQRTINHLCHRTNGLDYSVLGNAAYYPASEGDEQTLKAAAAHMMGIATALLRDLGERHTGVYFGYKTEVASSSSKRNYLYHILDRDSYTLALPGKFTLCFSLAVNVCRHFGIDPVERVRLTPQDVSSLIAEPLHYQLAKQLAAQQAAGATVARTELPRQPRAAVGT